jgi:PAS domain S-box-containing protein
MHNQSTAPAGGPSLRQRAEEEVREKGRSACLSEVDLRALCHELEVHQVELEMQNEELQRVQAELVASEEKYRDLYEFAPIGYLALEGSGKILEANLAAASILGTERAYLVNNMFQVYLADGSGLEFKSFCRRVMDSDVKQTAEFRLRGDKNKGRASAWVLVEGRAIRDGITNGFRMAVIDITERKRVEDQLKTTHQRFFTVLSNLYAGILLVSDEDKVEFANQAFCGFFNLNDSPQELIGLSSQEMFEKIKGAYSHPDEEVTHIMETVNQGKPVRGQEVAMQDGRTCLRDFNPICINGKSYGRLWHHLDITENKRMEEASRKSEQKFRGIVESSEEGISLIDDSGNIVEWNASQEYITGLKREEVLGRPVWDIKFQLIPQEQQTQEAYGKIKSFLHRQTDIGRVALKGWFGDQEIQSADGTRKTIHEVFFPIKTDRGYNIGVITHDITERAEVERSLRIKDEAIESALNAMSLASPSGDLFYANESWLRMLGYKREEIAGRSLLNFLQNPKDADEIAKQISTTGRWEGELVAKRKDGSTMDVHLSASTVKDRSDRSICVISSFIDISVSKKAQRDLMESENKLKAIFDLVPIGIYVVNKESRIISANQSFLDFMGLSLEELNQRKHWERRYFSVDGTVLPEPKDDSYKHFPTSKPIHEKEPTKYLEIGMEKENGEIVWANATAVPTPFLDWAAVVALLDITEHRKMEENLRIKDAALEAAITPMAICDLEGYLTYINTAASILWGYKKEEVLGRHSREFWGNPREFEVVRDSVLKTGHWSGDMVGKKKDGSKLDFHLSAALVKNAAGKPLCVHSSNLDITDRKKMEKDLREREERFRKIFELSPIGIQLFDSEGFLISANQASQEIMGKIDPARHKRYNIFRDVLADPESQHKLTSGQIVKEGSWIKTKSGKAAKKDRDMLQDREGQIYIGNTLTSIEGDGGEPEGYLCIQENLTEHKLAEEVMMSDNDRLQIFYDLWKARVQTSNVRMNDLGR